MKRIVTALWLLLLTCMTTENRAQDYASRKEKLYIQTNHCFYSNNEIVYFKAYVVRGEDNTPTVISNVVYAELISPAGTIVEKAKFPVTDGYAEGSFVFAPDAVGGIYKIRAYTSWMQNEKESLFFVKEVTLQKVLAPRILMKLDFPEKGYGPGDAVTAAFSMRNLMDEPIRNYAGKFTVFIGGNVIQQAAFTTDAEGKAKIGFTLPAALTVNDGLLTVTIFYESYTESISRSIPIVLNNVDLQFMPEGGTLVEGIESWVAFKALNENGKAADIKGEVRDESGNTVATFSSYHFGMGKFRFLPNAGHQYKAVITSPAGIQAVYPLPAAAVTGVQMHVEKQNKKITVLLNSSVRMEVKLRATVRNTTYYTENVTIRKGENNLVMDEAHFPSGIARFTLYAANEMPLAERLIFLNEDRQLNVQISFDKKTYAPREQVKLTIKTTGTDSLPVPSNFSLSVIDDKRWTFADDKQDHILSWLLLSSELKGKIEEPQFYFKKEEAKAVPALDLLMLTHGYRYFDFIDYIVQEGALKYLPDQDNIVSGVVKNVDGQPVQAKMFLMNNVSGGRAIEFTTGEDGQFFFSDLRPNSGYYLFAQSLNKSGRVVIMILQNGLGYNPVKSRVLNMPGTMAPLVFNGVPISPLSPKKENKAAWEEDRGMRIGKKATALNEVVVVGYAAMQKKDMTASVSVVRGDEIFRQLNVANALQGRVAGIEISQPANFLNNPVIRLRGLSTLTGNQEPLYIINGVPVDGLSVNTLNQHDIDYITVLKDGSASALYGSRAAYGAIIIETKKYRRERINLKFGNRYYYTSQAFTTNGTSYTPVRKFYAPRYQSTKTEERTDFRETIYWNPVVQTDKEGLATVSFYNSDASTTFRAIAEGIGFNGQLGRTENTYGVQSQLRVDAKIPPYLTVGDKAMIPLVIKNNSGEAGSIQITADAPSGFITGAYARSSFLQPDSAVEILIPLSAISASSGLISFQVRSDFGDEKILLPIAATDKGFPVKMVFSGNNSGRHEFPVNKMIPGTLNSKLQLFTSLEGQLLNGIESMLREPYGCFEQTSSSTYPNVFILKYLKESGKANKKTEQKALDYIQRGYKRLIGFETKEDGFEWFGNTPPHEALTAYGLLEFTDMKEFIDVDPKMLERTRKFLLSRRDGKGGFMIQNRGYDQFASVPNNIAHLYIVYALTEAGVTNEIEAEYAAAVKKALESNDAYQLALMALAADNMKDKLNYQQLISRLTDSPEKLKTETTVVNSRDASLRVETWSLHALALLRNPNPDLGRVAALLSKILGEKSYYGYGSTQATVLALKAITAYGRAAGKASGETDVQFTLNNSRVINYDSLNGLLQSGKNEFRIQYNRNENAVPYNLEVEYSTFTPPSSEKAELKLKTVLKTTQVKVGETVRMEIEVSNTRSILQPMAIAKIGIPAGLSLQPWQLKELTEKNKVAYYEIFDNYLVFYWMGFAPGETKTIGLDLKAEIPGSYKGKAGTMYLYYTPEYKDWVEGTDVTVGSR